MYSLAVISLHQESTIKASVLFKCFLLLYKLYDERGKKRYKVIADEMLIDLMYCFVSSLCRCIT